MFEIIRNNEIAENVFRLSIKAEAIAESRKAGQFVIVHHREGAERIPLTIVESDLGEGTIDIIVQAVGKNTKEICSLNPGEFIEDLAGPLGVATHIEDYGNCVVVGGGVGIAPLYPITKSLSNAGNNVTTILGARSKNLIILQDDMRSISKNLILATDDGSSGKKGLVTDALQELIDAGENIDFVLAIGPVVMMEAVSNLTKKYNIKTMVSLNPIMVDGTGMCGVCRCKVGDQTKFACVDGPEFDGHLVDFGNLKRRLRMFKDQEALSLRRCDCSE